MSPDTITRDVRPGHDGPVLPSVDGVIKHYTPCCNPAQRLPGHLSPAYRSRCESFTALQDVHFELCRGEALGTGSPLLGYWFLQKVRAGFADVL